jgi:hypothetical protein
MQRMGIGTNRWQSVAIAVPSTSNGSYRRPIATLSIDNGRQPAFAGDGHDCAGTAGRSKTKDDDMQWKDKVASLAPTGSREHSPARARVHAAFDEIAAAKARGVTWQQLTDLLTADGVRGAEGETLTVDAVRSLFHAERYARGERRKRRTRKPPVPPPAQAVPAGGAAPGRLPSRPSLHETLGDDPDDDPPAPVFKPSAGYLIRKPKE